MRSLICAICLVAASASAIDFTDLVSGSVAPTSSAAVTNVCPNGQLYAVSLKSTGGSATCTVTTVSGSGFSKGSSRTVIGAVVVTPAGVVTNLAATVPVFKDLLVLTVNNAAITSSVAASATVLVKEP